MKEFFEKVDFEKNKQTAKKHAKLPIMQRAKCNVEDKTFLVSRLVIKDDFVDRI